MHPLQVVANCLQEAISRPQSILLCFLAFTLFACEPQDSLSLTYTEHQGLQNFALHKIFFTDDKHGYAMGGDEYQYGVVQTTMDGGLTWSLDTISQKSGVAFKFGYMMRLTNDFQLIERITYPGELNALARGDAQSIYAVGYGQIYRSTDAGITWIATQQDGDNYQDVNFVNARVGWIVGQSGSILHTEDAGLSWELVNKPSVHAKIAFNGVYFSDEDNGAVVGDEGVVWTTNDGGANWAIVEDIPNYNYMNVFLQDDVAWLTTDQGNIIRLFL